MEYGFRCQKCQKTITVAHGISQPHPKFHKGCGGKLKRIFSDPPAVQYRGSGFFTTDKALSDPVEQ